MKDAMWLVDIALGLCHATNEIGSWIFIYVSWHEYFQMNWHMDYGNDIKCGWPLCFKQYHSYVVMIAAQSFNAGNWKTLP